MEWTLPLVTERLVLRALVAGDLAEHHRLFSDPQVVRFLYDEVLDLPSAEAHLARRLKTGPPGEGEWVNLAVEVDGTFLGEVGVTLSSRVHRQCEIGYVFGAGSHGQGYATEASAAVIDLAFGALGAHRVAGRMDARNDASARVMERLGMRREAHLRQNEFVKGEWTDEVVYSVLLDEWTGRSYGVGAPR